MISIFDKMHEDGTSAGEVGSIVTFSVSENVAPQSGPNVLYGPFVLASSPKDGFIVIDKTT